MIHLPFRSSFVLLGLLGCATSMPTPSIAAAEAKLTIQVDRPEHAIAPTLWGIFFEDINLSADGGIYPELVRNRSFEDSEKTEHWSLLTGDSPNGQLAIDSSKPLSPMNRRSLRLKIAGDGQVSLVNTGYWGMAFVKGDHYLFSLSARRGDGFSGPLTVALESRSGQRLAQGQIEGLGDNWKTFALEFQAAESDPQGRLVISATQKGTVWLDMVSLLPKKTWQNHGLRPDLCEMLDDLKPAFVRFPGGCWVEGDDMEHMNHWKHTIGDVAHRKPLWNIWGYWATHGLGYHEYLQMSEDLGAEPLFCINVGMSHREVIPMDQMGQWVQDALDAIEYANGPTNTVWGSLRARNGHPAPFNLKYLEIGNENGGPAYNARYPLFYHAIKTKYPAIHLIANDWGGVPKDSPVEIVDEHYYNNPDFFIHQANRYDSYNRNGPKIFVGEYAVTSGSGLGNLRGAIGEAAFMTGLERNSDVVVMASYAPLFVNVNHKRWPINLIGFDSSRHFGIPSYYVQQMFSQNRGDVVLPLEVDSPVARSAPKGGAVGVGTWLTQAEYKDIKVTRGQETLFASDFAQGTSGWKLHGGEWKTQDGALRQTSDRENVRAIAGDKNWSDYTLTLKARKLSGDEGFLVLFRVQNENEKCWWNIGGWGNQRHALEMGGVLGKEVNGRIETGRWYDIRVELQGDRIQCYLDGKLIHDATTPTVKSLYASASRDHASGEVILKVVNVSSEEVPAQINLNGATGVRSPARATVLMSESPTDENTIEQPTKVAPVTKPVEIKGAAVSHRFPGNSLTVLRLPLEK